MEDNSLVNAIRSLPNLNPEVLTTFNDDDDPLSPYITFDIGYDSQWSDDELLSHIVELSWRSQNLTTLPPLPLCKTLFCDHNQLTTLSSLPLCQTLFCNHNQLTTLGSPLPSGCSLTGGEPSLSQSEGLPQCQDLSCERNQLTTLPSLPLCRYLSCEMNQLTTLGSSNGGELPLLPLCQILFCRNNQLTTLPPLPLCRDLYCNGNPLPFPSLEEWKKVWRLV